jgi:hypothetical protein
MSKLLISQYYNKVDQIIQYGGSRNIKPKREKRLFLMGRLKMLSD